MPLPRVDEVNATRLSRFDDAITAALGETERVDAFRDIIDHYVRHHDVPEADVAAALAIVSQGEQPLLLDEADDAKFERDRAQAVRFLQEPSGRGDRGDRPAREDRGPRERRDDLVMYRIEVGRRQRVQPGQIVGALANEGGLDRGDFGRIQIREDFSLIELPKRLPAGALDRLAGTRIGGKPIDIKTDRGPSPRGKGWEDRGDRSGSSRDGRGYDRDERPRRDDRGGYSRDDRGSAPRNDRGYRDDRGYSRDDRQQRGDRGYSRDDRGDQGNRGGSDYGRNDRGGARDRNDRGYSRDDRNDRGGYSRGDRGDQGNRGGYRDDRREGGDDRADGKRKPRW